MYRELKEISRLQFITSDDSDLNHLEQIKLVLDNGIKWVQLRAKNRAPQELLKLAEEAKEILQSYEAKLIINDNHLVASMVLADGVHLGKDDETPENARKFLLNEIIGGTANSIEDVRRIEKHVDYIGLGPLRFTNTKKNLSPILGLLGYEKLIHEMQLNIPVVAIGGVVIEDIEGLMKTGVHGIAISGAILKSQNPNEKIKQFIKELEQYESVKS